MQIRVATFNMQNGQPWREHDPDNPEIDLEGSIHFLQSLDADLILLQEVEQGYEGGRQVEPPPNYTRLMAALSGYDSYFHYPAINPDELPFGLGLAIFSRFPLSRRQYLFLPAPPVEFEFHGTPRRPSQRLLLQATVEIHGKKLRVLNTHLQAFFMIGLSSERMRLQRDVVEQQLRPLRQPAILGGDFNCAPGELVVEQFARAGFQTAQSREITWRRQPFVLDHLFFNAGLELVESHVIPTDRSDHHAVLGVFNLL